jgi:hypothetical protein
MRLITVPERRNWLQKKNTGILAAGFEVATYGRFSGVHRGS